MRLDDGETLDRDALFFYVGWRLRIDVARTLGCRLCDDGSIAVDSGQATTVDRVYAAGNCADPRALVPAAAGSGVTAAVAINTRLSFEDADRVVADSRAPAPASEVRRPAPSPTGFATNPWGLRHGHRHDDAVGTHHLKTAQPVRGRQGRAGDTRARPDRGRAAQALGWPKHRVTARVKILGLPERAQQLAGDGTTPWPPWASCALSATLAVKLLGVEVPRSAPSGRTPPRRTATAGGFSADRDRGRTIDAWVTLGGIRALTDGPQYVADPDRRRRDAYARCQPCGDLAHCP